MERTRRAILLIDRANHIVQTGGDRQAAVQAMEEAVALLRKMTSDASRFRDLLAQPISMKKP
jgi:hypothetical protein